MAQDASYWQELLGKLQEGSNRIFPESAQPASVFGGEEVNTPSELDKLTGLQDDYSSAQGHLFPSSPESIAEAQRFKESSLDPEAVGDQGKSFGLYQMQIPTTRKLIDGGKLPKEWKGKDLSKDENLKEALFDPEFNQAARDSLSEDNTKNLKRKVEEEGRPFDNYVMQHRPDELALRAHNQGLTKTLNREVRGRDKINPDVDKYVQEIKDRAAGKQPGIYARDLASAANDPLSEAAEDIDPEGKVPLVFSPEEREKEVRQLYSDYSSSDQGKEAVKSLEAEIEKDLPKDTPFKWKDKYTHALMILAQGLVDFGVNSSRGQAMSAGMVDKGQAVDNTGKLVKLFSEQSKTKKEEAEKKLADKEAAELKAMRLEAHGFKREDKDRRKLDFDLKYGKAINEIKARYNKHPIMKELFAQGLSFDKVGALISQMEAGNTTAVAALGISYAKALGEKGVMTDKDVVRYIKSAKLSQHMKDQMTKLLNGTLSKATTEEIKHVVKALKIITDKKVKPIMNQFIQDGVNIGLTPDESKEKLFSAELGSQDYLGVTGEPQQSQKAEAPAAEAPAAGPHGAEVTKGGKDYIWNATAGKYQLK